MSFDFRYLPDTARYDKSLTSERVKYVHLHATLPRGSRVCACILPALLSLVEIREHSQSKATKVRKESRVGVVVRALAFHQCGPGLISKPAVICGLSLLVPHSVLRGFSPELQVSPKTNI